MTEIPSSAFVSVLAGGQAGNQLKMLVKMGNGMITHFVGNIRNGFFCFPQKLFRLVDSKLMEIFDIGLTGDGLEQITEMRFGLIDRCGQLIQRETFGVVAFQILDGSLNSTSVFFQDRFCFRAFDLAGKGSSGNHQQF